MTPEHVKTDLVKKAVSDATRCIITTSNLLEDPVETFQLMLSAAQYILLAQIAALYKMEDADCIKVADHIIDEVIDHLLFMKKNRKMRGME